MLTATVTAPELAWWAAFVGLVGSCAGLGWWLLFSPLPGRVGPAVGPSPGGTGPAGGQRPPPTVTRMSAPVVSIAIGMYFVLGTAGIWDAAWHMQYGIAGTISDFWSPPHLLMYASFGAIAGFTAFALVALLSGSGGIRERFRAQPLLGAFFLISIYQMGSGPLDELWHKVNGVDSTAWALPHFIIVVLAGVALALLGSLYHGAVSRRTPWTELVLLIPFAVILWTAMGVSIGDWEFTLVARAVPEGNPLLDRPFWAYPIAGMLPGAVVLGAVAALADRRWTSVAEVALLLVWSTAAFALFTLLGSSMPQWTTPLAYLAGAVAVDAVRGSPRFRGRPLAAGVVFATVQLSVAVALILGATRLVPLGPTDVAVAIGAGIPLGAFAYSLGHAIGTALRTLPERATVATTLRAAPAPSRAAG